MPSDDRITIVSLSTQTTSFESMMRNQMKEIFFNKKIAFDADESAEAVKDLLESLCSRRG